MNETIRILVTSASNRLANGIIRALKNSPSDSYFLGVDSSEYHIHQALVDERIIVPRANEDGYLETIDQIVREHDIDLVWPTHDAEIFALAKARESFSCPIVAPPADVVAVCRDKFSTYQCLKKNRVPTPDTVRIHKEDDLRHAFESMNGEIWLRPLSGAGAAGAYRPPILEKAVKWIEIYDGWGNFTASEVLPSTGDYGWESLWKDGSLVASQDMTRLVRGNTGLSIKGVKSRGVILRRAPESVGETAIEAVHAVMPEPDGIFRVDLLADHQGQPRVTEIEAGKFGADGVAFWHEYGYNFPHEALKLSLGGSPQAEPPITNPLPRDMVSISGLNQEITFRTEAEIAALKRL